MTKKKNAIPENGIYDARTLGVPKMLILGLQHMFAMFGATVLVPLLTGLDVASTLLFAGLGTLFFHLVTGGKVPAFLGSSFAFLGGYAAITGLAGTAGYETMTKTELLPYACLGVACAGLVYLVLAALIRAVGANKVMRFFPPVVTGPIIVAIGLGLAGSAVSNCQVNWPLALIALAIIIIFNVWGRGMAKIIPILLGVLGSCAAAAIFALTLGQTITVGDAQYIAIAGKENLILFSTEALQQLKDAAWIGLPVNWKHTVFGGVDFSNTSLIISSIVAIMPISLATMMEHIGDISAISSTVGKNYIKDPGLHRTLVGDGIATTLASLFGAPANTTYGENTGVLALTRVFDPRVIRIAACCAIVLSFCPKFAAVIAAMPACVIGGVSLVLYGMISAVGVRNLIENQVDFQNNRNVLVAALVLVLSLGIAYSTAGAIVLELGGVTISLSGLAVGSLVGIVLNAILPGNDFEFDTSELEETTE